MKLRRPAVPLLALALATCATYTSRMTVPGEHYYEGSYARAEEEVGKLVRGASNEDLHLYLLERGKIRLAAGDYDSAIVDLQAAERRFDEIEGTFSVGEALQTALASETSVEYQPPAHEKILISAYLLLAYWLDGDVEGALVERKRVIGRLERYGREYDLDEWKKLDVPFARYLTALLYELEGMADDAGIEYRRISRLSPGAVPGEPLPHLTELAVIAEIGRSPVKVSREVRGWFADRGGGLAGFFDLPGEGGPIVFPLDPQPFDRSGLGTVFTFAFPQYVRRPRTAVSCRVVVDGVEAGEAVTLDDIEETAMEAFRRNLGAILMKSALRTYIQLLAQNALDGDAGRVADALAKFFSAVERADTRSWQTLPAEIAVYRLEVDPGEHEVSVRYFDSAGCLVGESGSVEVTVPEGSKQIAYLPAVP